MNYYFDSQGFNCKAEDSVGSTTEPLPRNDPSVKWNWNGYEWIELPADHKVALPSGTGNPVRPTQQSLDEYKTSSTIRIDADCDDIFAAVVGNRLSEYSASEADATAYKTAGYTGQVPMNVHCWALAKGQSDQWAADNILATAEQWRGAQSLIRANRLGRKEDVKNSANAERVTIAMNAWDAFLVVIRKQLGI